MLFNIIPALSTKPIRLSAPKIFITPDAYAMVTEYVRQCPYEISWFSRVDEFKKGKFVILDAVLLNQTVSSSAAEFSEEDLSAFLNETLRSHGIEHYNQIRCWGHSHVNFPARPSGQDLDQILQFNEQDYYIMLIVNKKGDAHVAFYDFKNNVVYENIPVHLYTSNSREISEQVKQSIAGKVKMPSRIISGSRQISMDLESYNGIHRDTASLIEAAKNIYHYFSKAKIGDPYKLTKAVLDDPASNSTAFSTMPLGGVYKATGCLPVINKAKKTLGIKADTPLSTSSEWFDSRIDVLHHHINKFTFYLQNLYPLFEVITNIIEDRGWDITDLCVEEFDDVCIDDIEKWCFINMSEYYQEDFTPDMAHKVTETLQALQSLTVLSYGSIIEELYTIGEYEDFDVEEEDFDAQPE